MHTHNGFVSTLVTWAQVLLLMFFMRWIAAMWPDSSIGKALASLN